MSSTSTTLFGHDVLRTVLLSGLWLLLQLHGRRIFLQKLWLAFATAFHFGGLLAFCRPLLSCTCTAGLLPAVATMIGPGLRLKVPVQSSLQEQTSALGSVFSLPGLHSRSTRLLGDHPLVIPRSQTPRRPPWPHALCAPLLRVPHLTWGRPSYIPSFSRKLSYTWYNPFAGTKVAPTICVFSSLITRIGFALSSSSSLRDMNA